MLDRREIDELAMQFKDAIEEAEDWVCIFPMCKDDFGKTCLIGQVFDRAQVTDEIKALIV